MLNARFQDEVYHYYEEGLSIIPSALLVKNLNWRQNVQEFCDYYRQDTLNTAGFDAELYLWERMWRYLQARQADAPDRISDTFQIIGWQTSICEYFYHCSSLGYPYFVHHPVSV